MLTNYTPMSAGCKMRIAQTMMGLREKSCLKCLSINRPFPGCAAFTGHMAAIDKNSSGRCFCRNCNCLMATRCCGRMLLRCGGTYPLPQARVVFIREYCRLTRGEVLPDGRWTMPTAGYSRRSRRRCPAPRRRRRSRGRGGSPWSGGRTRRCAGRRR